MAKKKTMRIDMSEVCEKDSDFKRGFWQKLCDFFRRQEYSNQKQISKFVNRNGLKASIGSELEWQIFVDNHAASMLKICEEVFKTDKKMLNANKSSIDAFYGNAKEADDYRKSLQSMKLYEDTFLSKTSKYYVANKGKRRMFKKIVEKAFR